MDVGVWLGQVLARPVGRALGLDDADGPWRVQLREQMCLSENDDELVLRHLARSAVWFVVMGVVFVVSMLVLAVVMIDALPSDVVYALIWFPVFFAFFVGSVHIVKMSVVHYTPERWWLCRDGVFFRLAMLSEVPDFVVAGLAAFVVVWLL